MSAPGPASRFRCMCGSMNQFNPQQGWLVQCGVCQRVVQLTPPKLLVRCPGCQLKMTMDPNVAQAKCPKCGMIFTTQKPSAQQPPPVQGAVAGGGNPAMGTVIAGQNGANQQQAPTGNMNQTMDRTACSAADMPTHTGTMGGTSRSTAPPSAGNTMGGTMGGTRSEGAPLLDDTVEAPAHFNMSMPLPMEQQNEEEHVWAVANEQFDLTATNKKSAGK